MFSFNRPSKVSALFLCLFLPLLASSVAVAAPFTATYTDTISDTNIPGLSIGQPATITIVMDNGGATNVSQTWTSADVTSITFDFNNGAITTAFSATGLGGGGNVGDFVTDAAGVLTAVPSSWYDVPAIVISTNDPDTPNAFYINGYNRVYGSSSSHVYMNNVGNNTVAAFWSLASVTDDPFTPIVSNRTSPSVPEYFSGYVANGSFKVSVADGASCTGTIYNIAVAPKAGSSPLGNTPAAPSPGTIINATAAGSPYLFSAAGSGTYDVSVTETGSCNQVTDPELTTATITDPPSADLSLAKIANGDVIASGSGQEIVYTITVNNAGPDDAENVVVTDKLSGLVVFKSTDGCVLNDPTGVPQCNLGTVPAFSSISYEIVGRLLRSDETITNSAFVVASTLDPDHSNNSASVETELQAVAIPVNNPVALLFLTLLLGGLGWRVLRHT